MKTTKKEIFPDPPKAVKWRYFCPACAGYAAASTDNKPETFKIIVCKNCGKPVSYNPANWVKA